MSLPDDFDFSPETYSGIARLFPLPDTVLFPNVIQPLHIFEPRYRQMVEEALTGDKLIAMAVLAPGWESDYEGSPPLRRYGCLCRISTHVRLEDGTYNILMLGLRRIELEKELGPTKLFREARVRILEDEYPASGQEDRGDLQAKLLIAFRNSLPRGTEVFQQLEQLFTREIPLGILTDVIGFTLSLDLEMKLRLLTERNVDSRAKQLLAYLGEPQGRRDGLPGNFPPDFSVN